MTPLHSVIFLGIIAWVRCTVVSTEKDGVQVSSTSLPVSQQAERRMSVDVDDLDSLPQSSDGMSSYSSVLIHHPVPASHTGPQATSQWTIEDHKPSGFQRNLEVESNSQIQHVSQPSRRHRHHSRGSATAASHIRDDVTERPESLSTAQTFFRLRGYKGKASTKKDESDVVQEDANTRYDDSGSRYDKGTGHGQRQSLPPGMTHDLMNALLSQQPQTFDYGYKSPSRSDDIERSPKNQDLPVTVRPSRKPQKKYKNQIQTETAEKAKKRLNNKNRDSFNVGYSIGFGNPTTSTVTEIPSYHETPNDVVLGRPKSNGQKSSYRLHVNGENSVWKEIHPGVEMSEETVKNRPLSLSIPEKSEYYPSEAQVGLLSGHPGQSVYYVNGIQEDYNVPTTGQATFDHAHALGQSNTFDFSNAVSHPLSPQNKPDPSGSVKTGKNMQSIQYNKHESQSYHIPYSQKPTVSYSAQPQSYLPYSLEANKPSANSKNDYSFSPSHSPIKPSKNQQTITSTGLAGGYDLSHFMGLGTPVPIQNVFIPGRKDGEGQMVPAIVIPISQLNTFDDFGPGLNYPGESGDGFQPFGGDVFNVVPPSMPKESQKVQNSGKYTAPKQHSPRIHENKNKSFRGGKGGIPGLSSLINLSAPEHLDNHRPPHSKHPRADHPRMEHGRPDSMRPYAAPNQKIFAPKFSPQEHFRDSPVNLKRSPSNRNARLAHLQTELNSILAEEMYRKNRPNRRQVPPPHPPHPKIRLH